MRSSAPKKPHNGQHNIVLWSVLLCVSLMQSLSVRGDAISGQQEEPMARSLAAQQMETTARTYFERVNKGDVEGILALFADDAHVIHPMTSEAGIRGKAALRASYQDVFRTLVAYHAEPTDIIIDGNTLVAPLHFEGKTKDGTLIAMNNLNLWTFEHGKFKVMRIYMDTYPYRQALSQALGRDNT
jgi:ketosteroid isomerase-like protein